MGKPRKTIADYPNIAAEFHPSKNGDLKPSDVSYGSKQKFWWKCDKGDDHEWEMCPNNRTNPTRPQGCSICAGQKVVLSNCLATTHPELSKEWHPTKNIGITPCDVRYGSHRMVWWKCDKGPDHEWDMRIKYRTQPTYGRGCTICAGHKVVPSTCLATTHPELSKEWHPSKNGNLTPYDVSYGSGIKVWWKCDKGDDHEWEMSPNTRTNPTVSQGCPICRASKGEKRVAEVLNQLGIPYERQLVFLRCRNINGLPFDFGIRAIDDKAGVIEYQGEQHYYAIKFFGGEKGLAKRQHNDQIKRDFCQVNRDEVRYLEIPYWRFDDIEPLVEGFVKGLLP